MRARSADRVRFSPDPQHVVVADLLRGRRDPRKKPARSKMGVASSSRNRSLDGGGEAGLGRSHFEPEPTPRIVALLHDESPRSDRTRLCGNPIGRGRRDAGGSRPGDVVYDDEDVNLVVRFILWVHGSFGGACILPATGSREPA